MGHINFEYMVKIISTQAMGDFPNITKLANIVIKEYHMGKQTRNILKNKEYSTTKPL